MFATIAFGWSSEFSDAQALDVDNLFPETRILGLCTIVLTFIPSEWIPRSLLLVYNFSKLAGCDVGVQLPDEVSASLELRHWTGPPQYKRFLTERYYEM